VYSCSSLLFLSFGADLFVFVAYFVGAIELRQAGGSSAHDLTVDGDSPVWPHMNPDYLSRLTGPGSWTPLPPVHSSGLHCLDQSPSTGSLSALPANACVSLVYDVPRFEAGYSSSVAKICLPTDMPPQMHVHGPAPVFPLRPPVDLLPDGMTLLFLCFLHLV
jgi:hypothetical protein